MDKPDLQRLVELRAARGRATRERGASLKAMAAALRARSKGLTSQSAQRRRLDLTKVQDGATAREAFNAAGKRAR